MIFVPDDLTVYFFHGEIGGNHRVLNQNKNKKREQKNKAHQPMQQRAQANAQKYLEKFHSAEICIDDNEGMHAKEVLEDMTVYVRMTKGKTIRIHIDKKQTLEQMSRYLLKLKEGHKSGKEQQRLVSQGRILRDKPKFKDTT